MDEASFRVLDTLSREIGSTLSIHQLAARIREYYGTGYYARTYNRLNDLSRQGYITLTKAGRSSVPALDFSSYILPDLLSEIEMRKKREFLERFKNFKLLLMDIESYAHANPEIESVSLIEPDRNSKLNRAELLVVLHGMDSNSALHRFISILTAMRNLQGSRTIRIDPLLLTDREFGSLLTRGETNPLKEALPNRITFYNPNSFWLNISEIMRAGGKITPAKGETNPAKISDKELYYNLSRFGYSELGIEPREGRQICIEYIVTALLIRGEARAIDSIPIILAKNKANYRLLIFLSEKYKVSGALLGLLKALHQISSAKETVRAIEILQSLGAREVKANRVSIREKLKVYGAIRE